MKAMAYDITNGLSMNRNKSVVHGKESSYITPSFCSFPICNHWSVLFEMFSTYSSKHIYAQTTILRQCTLATISTSDYAQIWHQKGMVASKIWNVWIECGKDILSENQTRRVNVYP